MLPAFLAATEMSDPKSSESLGWLLMAGSSIVIGAYYILLLWRMLFPKEEPPAHALYATKAELAAVKVQIEEDAEKAKQEHKESDERIEKRFESWMGQQQEQHADSMRKFDEAMERFSSWQLTMERALGVIGTKADIALEAKQKR